MLDVVIQTVTDVVTDVPPYPFGDVTLEAVQGCCQQTETEQQQSGSRKNAGLAIDNALIDHPLDDARHKQG